MENKTAEPGSEEILPPWLTALDHTADAGIGVTANSLAELLARAAWGMFSVIADVRAVQPRETQPVIVEAADTQALMVRWLSELNFRHITEHRLFCNFEVTHCTGNRLEAAVFGENIDPARHTVFTEIKAVTFHGLRVEQTDGGWKAEIIFDL